MAELDLQSGLLYSETVKESVGLNILNAYLQVLYAYESVSNAEKQIISTTEQLNLSKERMDLGVISMSDYLQIKSELAAEKSTLASAKSQLAMGKVTLMQLMELPVDASFEVSSPNLNSSLSVNRQNNLEQIVEKLGPRIHFTHLRNNVFFGNREFHEYGHIEGDIDMYPIVKALLKEQIWRKESGRTDFRIPFRPDHGVKMFDDYTRSANPGYPLIDRLKGLAELSGMQMAIERELKGR